MGPRRVAVAASGGRDSTALLHATVKAAVPLGVEVVALHVHHGLQAAADDWLRLVRDQARRWGAGFDARRLDGKPSAGESIEAWARRERYRALGDMARAAGCPLVLLAHHRRDQAETWLLQALRGGGPRGLSAMPKEALRQGLTWARPWLDQPREAVEAYVRRHRLRYVDDGSNADSRFARNALRRSVWPALTVAFPDAEATLSAAAREAQGAARLADEVAALDLPPLQQGDALDLAAWAQLPPARRHNVLRAWLAQALPSPVPSSLLQRLAAELPARRSARWPAPGGELRLYRGLLTVGPDAATEAAPPAAQVLDLNRPATLELPAWHGCLVTAPVQQGGAPAQLLRQVTAAARHGGERFSLSPTGLPRSLKKQFQARAVPAWERDGPLLFTTDGRLLFVPGLGIDATLQAAPGRPQLGIHWQRGMPGPRQAGP
jgi:tRNA(Ile)-lysidine synthase